jgi:hypothetical protein
MAAVRTGCFGVNNVEKNGGNGVLLRILRNFAGCNRKNK